MASVSIQEKEYTPIEVASISVQEKEYPPKELHNSLKCCDVFRTMAHLSKQWLE